MDEWSPEHEYYLRANPIGGYYKEFDYDTVMFLLRGGYIVFYMTKDIGIKCHYFERA